MKMFEYKKIVTFEDENLAKRYAKGLINIIDDEAGVLDSLRELIQYEGYACNAFASVDDFLIACPSPPFAGPRCILSDMSMPGKNGLQLQQLLPIDTDQPVIFMSGIAGVEHAAVAFRRGAVHFITKPINDVELFIAIEEALQLSREKQNRIIRRRDMLGCISKLTPREREIILILIEGLSIKEIARKMSISERAVKLHKRSVLSKMNCKSLIDLVKLPVYELINEYECALKSEMQK